MLAKTVGVTRYCYNWGLSKWNEMHERGEKCDPYTLSRLWTTEKPVWANEVSRQPQTKTLLDLGGAFKSFFSGRKKHPTFHKKGRHDSFYVNNVQAFIRNGTKLHLPNIGDVRMAERLRFEGKVMRFVVSRHAGMWYAGVAVELCNEPLHTVSDTIVGVDVGSKHWAVASDGSVLDRPKKIDALNSRLVRAKRTFERKQRGSHNRDKARLRVARLYKRIRDVKMDAVHKFTNTLAKNHGVVCCENLCVVGMKNGPKPMRKAVQSSCMSELRLILQYKAKHYVEVDRFYPSSKTCSRCGAVMKRITLSTRTFRCPCCGLVRDRDLNAAINIRDEGMRVFTEGHSGRSQKAACACGGR